MVTRTWVEILNRFLSGESERRSTEGILHKCMCNASPLMVMIANQCSGMAARHCVMARNRKVNTSEHTIG